MTVWRGVREWIAGDECTDGDSGWIEMKKVFGGTGVPRSGM